MHRIVLYVENSQDKLCVLGCGWLGEIHVFELSSEAVKLEYDLHVSKNRFDKLMGFEGYGTYCAFRNIVAATQDTLRLRLKTSEAVWRMPMYAPVIGPRRPVPALPAEAHSVIAFDHARAWAVLEALCKG